MLSPQNFALSEPSLAPAVLVNSNVVSPPYSTVSELGYSYWAETVVIVNNINSTRKIIFFIENKYLFFNLKISEKEI